MKISNFPFIWFTILLMWLFQGCRQKQAVENTQTFDTLKNLFADPPAGYRSAPLWDWNDDITREGIDFQLAEFKKAGIGGVFVHPRPGLITEYLSDEWFQLFDHTVQKGKELGMNVWIYDENSYPSGFAGGHVPAQMPDSYRNGAGLSLEIQDRLDILISDTIAVVLRKNKSGFENVTDALNQFMGTRDTFYIFRKTYPSKSPWYGGFTYVDLLYPGVTEKFLELTMTKGYERNQEDFGVTVKGIFTDEPNLQAAMSRGSLLRWTPDLWDVFEKRWGYDLKVNLPSLLEETGQWKKVRHDYYELLLELFVDRWARPWSKYCGEKGLQWTGHYWEHGWPEPTDGHDEAAFYIWHQMPGVDMLGNRLDTAGYGGQFGNDRAVRELQSAANQAGWTRQMSETYGGGGWEMNFKEQKRLVDWECVMGVNFVNQHLSYYSMNGVRKFDYPPSFSYQEPWWEHYRLMGDYIGRMCLALSSGQQINTTLVLQPNTTAWMYFSRKVKNPAIDSIRKGFKHFVYRLEQLQVEYDLGSENVLKVLGSVQGDKLKVGKRDYSLVVIPAEMENLDSSTLDLLKKFLEGGGKILSFNKNMDYVDGVKSPLVKELALQFPAQWLTAENPASQNALDLLHRKGDLVKDLTRNGMTYHQRRVLEDGELFFLVNSHPSEKARMEVTCKGRHAALLDLVSGKMYNYTSDLVRGKVTFKVDLEPAGSGLFVVTSRSNGLPEFKPVTGKESLVAGSGKVAVKRETDNVLMINYLDLKTAKSTWKDVYFMNGLISLFTENGIEMGNPWQHKIQYKKDYLSMDTLFGEKSGFEATYHFKIDPELSPESLKSLKAVVERPDRYEVSVNGRIVTPVPGVWWIDKQFPVFSIGEFVHPGNNMLTLKATRMTILTEVMPVYILGDFLVRPLERGFEITGGELASMGSWKSGGMPFYSQKVAYTEQFGISKASGEAFKVRLNKWSGPVAEVLVNGQSAGCIAWPPYELDVTDFLKEGDNEITVKITGSLKNTFGFFYSKNDGWIFGPWSWNSAPEKIPAASEYFLMDYGLFEPFSLVKM